MKKHLELWPLYTVLAFLLSYINLQIYYRKMFGISIPEYFDITEIIFTNTSLILLFVYLPMSAIVINQNLVVQESEQNNTNLSIFDTGRYIYPMFIIPFLLLAIIYSYNAFYSGLPYNITHLEFGSGAMLIIVIVHWMFVVVRTEKLNLVIDKSKLMVGVIIVLTFFFILYNVVTINIWRANNIKEGYKIADVEVTLADGNTIKTDTQILYIGGSSRYLFFIQRINNQEPKTIIIPKSDVKRLTITNIENRY